jgi:hypothetical protein
MKVTKSERGFPRLDHEDYPGAQPSVLALASSVIYSKYPDAMQRPGTSALWIGADHHLDREQVAELIQHLQSWLDTGRFKGDAA